MSDRDTEDLGALRAELATALARARKAEREHHDCEECPRVTAAERALAAESKRADAYMEVAREEHGRTLAAEIDRDAALAREARLREAVEATNGRRYEAVRAALSDTTADAWLAERDGRTRDAALAEVEAMLRHESAEWASHNIALGYQASADRVAAMRRKP